MTTPTPDISSGRCSRRLEHTAAGVTLSFLCGLDAGHSEPLCEPRDGEGRDPRTHEFYRPAPARRVAARRSARARAVGTETSEKEAS